MSHAGRNAPREARGELGLALAHLDAEPFDGIDGKALDRRPELAALAKCKAERTGNMIARTAREVLGAPVIRVLAPNTKPLLLKHLRGIDLSPLRKLRSEVSFRKWFSAENARLARVIRRCNPERPSIYPGYKWGHVTKTMRLYCRDMVLRTQYFGERDAKCLLSWLYVPLDGIVVRKLRQCGVGLPFRQIREIDTKRKFFDAQDLLGSAATQVGVPRVLFDDVWLDH